MRSSKFGYLLLTGIVFATPACKIETHVDTGTAGTAGTGTGGSSGMSGSAGKGGNAGQGGSAGQSGSAGNAGSTEEGGASGAAEAGAAGAKETGGAAGAKETGGAAGESSTCDTSGFEFPQVTCDSGSVSEYTNPTCQDVLLCIGLADCATSHMDCTKCLDYLKVAFAGTDSCIQAGTQAALAEACNMIAAESVTDYPMCAPK